MATCRVPWLAAACWAVAGATACSNAASYPDAVCPNVPVAAAPDAGAPAAAPDAGAFDGAGASSEPPRVLIHTLRTGFSHPSTEAAAQVLGEVLIASGFTVQVGQDPGVFTDRGLAPFKVVVMAQTSGVTLGCDPSSIDALVRFVRGGGGLVGFHAASDVGYPADSPYVALIGGKFNGHPGNVRAAPCRAAGAHPSVSRLPAPFVIRDEIYVFSAFNAANQVVLTCGASGGQEQLPTAWYRHEGAGRVFYSGLGHGVDLWAPGGPLVKDHLLPAILWAAAR
jgi:type 1 glutamine amidotransferase